jgi:vacuolar-type H+-ATPase subunit C/Vma6
MLKKDELNDLINSDDVEEFLNLFNKTYYAKEEISFDIKNINASFERTLNKIHKNFVKKNPNSLARVYMYFDKKNYEIHYTTRIIENIRYKKINI